MKRSIARSDFKLKTGAHFRREHGTFFSVSFGMLPNRDDGAPQVACVVSKKTAQRAVDRNLIKRRCRAAARDHLAGVAGSLTLVFYAKRAAHGMSYSAIKEDIRRLIGKALAAHK